MYNSREVSSSIRCTESMKTLARTILCLSVLVIFITLLVEVWIDHRYIEKISLTAVLVGIASFFILAFKKD